MAPLRLDVVTAESEAYSGSVDYLVAPGADGQLTILPSHAALMTSLAPGEMRFAVSGGEDEEILAITGGFMEVLDNHVTVLADAAERDDEIDLERAEEAVRRAEERIASNPGDLNLERALAQLHRARVRVRVSRRRRASRGATPPTQ